MKKYDVIVVGTGIAGLYCSLNLSKRLKVLLITKNALAKSNSSLAQGGIAALRGKEDFTSYLEDTLKAGRYKNDVEAVKVMISESPSIIEDLIRLGVNFDRAEDGTLKYTREGAHSIQRILHHKDVTGKEITNKLINCVKERNNIEIKENCMLLDIIKSNHKCTGAIIEHNNEIIKIHSDFVVLATGGIGGLFNNSTNYSHLKGDGIAIAIKNNVRVKNMSYIQIHPTALLTKKSGRRFLISEAVRGEGGHLINPDNNRFVNELLPRDIVSNKIHEQMEIYNSKAMRLLVTHLGEDKIKERFPNIYLKCLDEGYDLTKEPIPITPAQHYFMGGIDVDLYGQTSLGRLLAIGETSCTGVHGANRLASNSLLEASVFAKRAAYKINETLTKTSKQFSIRDKGFKKSEFYNKELENVKRCNLDYKINYDLVLQAIKKEDKEFYDKWIKHS